MDPDARFWSVDDEDVELNEPDALPEAARLPDAVVLEVCELLSLFASASVDDDELGDELA